MDQSEDRHLTPFDVTQIIPGITIGRLAQMRFRGDGPRYYKPTPKTVIYKESEVRAWIESTGRNGTAE